MISIRGSFINPIAEDLALPAGSATTLNVFLEDVPVGGLGAATFTFQIYSVSAAAVILTKTPTITDTLFGVMTITLATADTESLTSGTNLYTYSLYQTNVSTAEVCLATGYFNVTQTARY